MIHPVQYEAEPDALHYLLSASGWQRLHYNDTPSSSSPFPEDHVWGGLWWSQHYLWDEPWPWQWVKIPKWHNWPFLSPHIARLPQPVAHCNFEEFCLAWRFQQQLDPVSKSCSGICVTTLLPSQSACLTQTKLQLNEPQGRSHGAADGCCGDCLFVVSVSGGGHNDLCQGYVSNSTLLKIPIKAAPHSLLWSNVWRPRWWMRRVCFCLRAEISAVCMCLVRTQYTTQPGQSMCCSVIIFIHWFPFCRFRSDFRCNSCNVLYSHHWNPNFLT